MSDENNHVILDDYIKPRSFRSNTWLLAVVGVCFIILFVFFKDDILEKKVSLEALKSSIEVFNISSQWVVKKEIDDEDFKGVILVPEIRFQVRNIGEVDLKHVFFLGVFRFLDTGKIIGEGFKMAFTDGLETGNGSQPIILTSQLGYRASSTDAFEKNRRDWRSSFVEIFIKSKNSQLTFFKSYYISRKIEGMNLNVVI
jgi:hypothetical protein